MPIVLRHIQTKLLCVLALGLCASQANPANAETKLHIFAAASLKGPLDEAAFMYSESHNMSVTVSFASSAAAARQITYGAPADIYISANPMWADYLVEHKALIETSRRDLVSNRLVLVSNQSDTTFQGWSEFPAYLNDKRLAVGQTQTVPAGIYAYQAFKFLGIWSDIKNNIIETENVRTALAYVHTKAVDFGIVYESDLVGQTGVYPVATVPRNSHEPIRYVAAAVSAGQVDAANEFLDYLETSSVRDIFTSYGFLQLIE